MDNIYYVYAHVNIKTNEIFYIGKGKGGRLFSKNRRSDRWVNYVNKYGYKAVLLEQNITEEEAFLKEVFYIKNIGRADKKEGLLINMSDGGSGGNNNLGRVLSDEWKIKIGLAGKGKVGYMKGKKHSQEVKDKISASLKGRPAYWLKGKKLSAEHIKKSADSHRGKKRSLEAIEKTRMKTKGKKRTIEQIENNRIAQLKCLNYTCDYCDIVTGAGNISRYHGEKCKHKTKLKI